MAKDLFSSHAATYAKWRPGYPTGLIEYIVSFVHNRDAVWDCATGNGQAAILLADHFHHVFATDLSSEQLKHARQHPAIIYSQSPAERTAFADNSFDLVTVAQAYHWFDQPAFCKEAKRVCKPGAVVAIWTYYLPLTLDDYITGRILYFYKDVTGPYWDEARKYVDDMYTTVYFDFEEIPVDTPFSIESLWTIEDLAGYLNSWSAVQKYIKVHNENPVDAFIADLAKYWKDGRTITFKSQIALRMGRV